LLINLKEKGYEKDDCYFVGNGVSVYDQCFAAELLTRAEFKKSSLIIKKSVLSPLRMKYPLMMRKRAD
jgi:hypothetical protein